MAVDVDVEGGIWEDVGGAMYIMMVDGGVQWIWVEAKWVVDSTLTAGS